MNLKQKFVGTVGALALGLSMTAGIASAQIDYSESKDDTYLDVTCPSTSTVEVSVSDRFSVDASTGANSFDSDVLDNAFQVTLDLTCNWSPGFLVNAQIGAFEYTGGQQQYGTSTEFSGSHLYLSGGEHVYHGPIVPAGSYLGVHADEPEVHSTVFNSPWQAIDLGFVHSDNSLVRPLVASPGVTEVWYDGQLKGLPANLSEGEYKAPLIVELVAI